MKAFILASLLVATVAAVHLPVDTPEVQQARAEHFAAYAKLSGKTTTNVQPQTVPYDGRFGYHIPTISNGVPVEPEAVQLARAEHLAKVGAVTPTQQFVAQTQATFAHPVTATATPYDGRYGYHIPTIQNGVPVEPEAVQLARAAHLAKVHSHVKRDTTFYDGRFGYHIPTILNGVPVEPEAVQRARIEHFAKAVHAGANNGVVFETPEVQHAKAQHFAAIAAARTQNVVTVDDGSWYEGKYV